MEVGGSTDLAAWLPRAEALGLELLSAARYALTEVETPTACTALLGHVDQVQCLLRAAIRGTWRRCRHSTMLRIAFLLRLARHHV